MAGNIGENHEGVALCTYPKRQSWCCRALSAAA